MKDDSLNNKKHITEVLRYSFNLDAVVQIFNKDSSLIEMMAQCFENLSEQRGLQLMKTFNTFIINYYFGTSQIHSDNLFSSEIKKKIIKVYFTDYLLNKIKELINKLDKFDNYDEIFKTQERRQKKEKIMPYGKSLIIFDEIFSNVINLLEEIVKQNIRNKQSAFYDYIEKVCMNFLNLMEVNIEKVKRKMDESYFRDFIQMIQRALTFFANLLLRDKEETFENQIQIKKLSTKVKEYKKFIDVVLQLMIHIPIDIPKFKEECFTNVKNFAILYPEEIIKHITQLSNDKFFLNESKIYYDFDVVRSIYFSWISTLKVILKKYKEIPNFQIKDYQALFENLCGILFDDNNHLNYVPKVLNYISNLLEQMMGNKEITQVKYFDNFLSNIIQRLVEFLKITKFEIQEIIQCLSKIKKTQNKNCSLDQISKLTKSELIEFMEKNSQEVLKEELISKENIYTRIDPNILIQNTVIVDFERDNKLQDFLEEKIFKRLSNLNDLLLKVFKNYIKQIIEKNDIQPEIESSHKFYQFILEYPEFELLRKIFKYNIQIIDLFVKNVEILEQNGQSQIKHIQLKLYEFVYWSKKQEYNLHHTMVYNQIYNLIDKNIIYIIRAFKNIDQQQKNNNRDYFQILLESLGCLFGHIFSNDNIDQSNQISSKQIQYAKYLSQAVFNIMIQKVIEIMNKDNTLYFDLLYDKDSQNDESYLISILKAIYRTVKYKHKVHVEKLDKNRELSQYKYIYFEDVLSKSQDLILVLIQQIYKKKNIYNYLYILKIVFNVMLKYKEFSKKFAEFCVQNNFKYFDFIKHIFQSNYEELKIIAIDLLIEFPKLPLDLIMVQYEDVSKIEWLIDMFIYAIDGKELNVGVSAWQTLNCLFQFFDEKQIMLLFNNKLKKFFKESLKINNIFYEKFSFLFKRNPSQEYFFRMKGIVKSIEKYSEIIKKSRNFITFDFRDTGNEIISIKFKNQQNEDVFPELDLGSFIFDILQQLRYLKKKPWFHNLNTSSKNFNYLYSNKTYVILCLDKLFGFLTVLSSEIKEQNQNLTENKLFRQILESLYLICFFIRIFKVVDLNQEKFSEFTTIQKIFENLLENEENHNFVLSFLMRNIFTYLKISYEHIENPIYNFSRQKIYEILDKEELKKNEKNQKQFVNELISVFNKKDYHQLEAVFPIFEKILDNIENYQGIKKYIIRTSGIVLRSYQLSSECFDQNFKIQLHEDFLRIFKKLSLFILRNQDPNRHGDILSFFRNQDNFQTIDILKVKIEIEQTSTMEDLSDIEFKNIKKYIIKKCKFFKQKIDYRSISLEDFWSQTFIKEMNNFIYTLSHQMNKNFFDIDHQNFQEEDDLFKIIFQLFKKILESTIEFSKEERQQMNILLLDQEGSGEEDRNSQNPKIFYQNKELGIHVDYYDLKIKNMSFLISQILNFNFDFFLKYYNLTEKYNQINGLGDISYEINDTNKLSYYFKEIKFFIKKLAFRIEKQITDAIFNNKLKELLKKTQSFRDQEIVQMIFHPFKLMKNNQINIPVMNIYFKQLKNYQCYLDMEQIQQNMEKCVKDQIEILKQKINLNPSYHSQEIVNIFATIKKIIQIQNWLKVIHNQRERNFKEMKKTIELQLFLSKKDDIALSIIEELLLMINKQSNTLFFKFIKHDLQRLDQDGVLPKFYLVYDMLKNKNSICMRERLSREGITDLVEQEFIPVRQSQVQYFVWLPILYQICRHSKYFFKSKNFGNFCPKFKEQIQKLSRDNPQREMISTIKAFFNPSYLFVKIMKIYLKMYPFDDSLDYYISYFLIDKNYSLKNDIFCFIQPFKNEKQEMLFVQKIKKCTKSLREQTHEQIQVNTFYLSQMAPKYLFYLSEKGLDSLVDVCKKYDSKEFTKITINSYFVALVKFFAFVYQKWNKPIIVDINLKEIFTHSWNNIAHPKDGDERIKNICIFLVSTFFNKGKSEIEKNLGDLLKPLFDTVLTETKILDNESKLLWLSSLKLLLQVHDNVEINLLQKVIQSNDINDSTFSSKYWWSLMEMRGFFNIGIDFIDYIMKNFQDPYISLNDSFDFFLILLTLLIKHRDSQKVKEFFTEEKKQKLISKLFDNYVKETQELNNEDKFFNLLVVYLRYFDDIQYNQNDIVNNFLNQKKWQRASQDLKTPKFSKISILNLKLIYIYLLNASRDENTFKKVSKYVISFIPNHKANTDTNSYIKNMKIPIYIFNLLKVCFQEKDNLTLILEKFETFQKQYFKQNKDIMIGIYFYHFFIEHIEIVQKFKIINIEKMLDHIINSIYQDKSKHNFKSNTRHYAKGLFELKENHEIEHNYSYLALLKFFAATLLKTLFLTFKYHISSSDYKYLIQIITKISQKITLENYLIKHTLLSLVNSIIFPKNPQLGWENFTSTAFSLQQKCEIILALQIPDNFIQKDSLCLHNQLKNYVNQYFDIILQFMYVYQPLSREFTVFLTNQVFDLFIYIDEDKKELFIQRLGLSLNHDLFSKINFFLQNWEPDRMSALVLHKEGNDILGLILIYFIHCLKSRSSKIEFLSEGKVISSNPELFKKFIGFIECKGFSSSFSREFVENLFKLKIKNSTKNELEKFIVMMIDTLRNDANLLYYDYISLINIFLKIYPEFINSDLILKALLKNENKFELLKYIQNNEELTEKQSLLIHSILDNTQNNPLYDYEDIKDEELRKIIAKVTINRRLKQYVNVKNEIENYFKKNDDEKKWEKFDVKSQITEQFLLENWIDAKKNLSQWDDLETVSKDTEHYELKLSCSKALNNQQKKFYLLQSDCRPKNESQGIVELTTCLLENIQQPNQEMMKQKNQKDLLFVYNFFYQNNNNIFFSQDNLDKVVNSHQLTTEFQISFDIFQKSFQTHNTIIEMKNQNYEWSRKLPSKNRKPYEANLILSQRNFLNEKFFNLVNTNYEQNKILLQNSTFFYKLQLLKIQRKNNLPRTFELEEIVYEDNLLQKLAITTLYKLYKENYYHNKIQNCFAINQLVQKFDSEKQILKNKFHVFDLKCSIKKNDFKEGFEIARKIIDQTDEKSVIGKYYELFFQLLYQFILQSNVYKEEFLIDLFDAFTKALNYNYNKNASILFYKFFLVNKLFPNPERTIRNSQEDNHEILSEGQDLKSSIEYCLNNIPLKIFKQNLLEICNSLNFTQNGQQERNIFNMIFMKLLNENQFDICYSIEKLKLNVKAEFFKELHNKLKKDLKLLENSLTFTDLGLILEKYSKIHNFDDFINIRQIIENYYIQGKCENDIMNNLINKHETIKNKLKSIQQTETNLFQRLIKLMEFLEIFIQQKFQKQKSISVPEFLQKSEIYIVDFKEPQLVPSQNFSRKKFLIQPYLNTELQEGHVNLVITLQDEAKKQKKLRIKPFYSQRRKTKSQLNPKNNSVFTLYEKVNRIFFELFFKNEIIRDQVPDVLQNFVILNNNWYLTDDLPSISIEKIINSHYKKNDFKQIHEAFEYMGLEKTKKIEKMVQKYPNTVFRNYLMKNLKIQEQYYYFTQKLAGSVAYNSFMKHVFGFHTNFLDSCLNQKNGYFYFDIASDLYEQGQPFKPRLTPNFQRLFTQNIINNDFLPMLVQMGRELQNPDNEIYLQFVVLLMDLQGRDIRNLNSIKERVENYKTFLMNFDLEKMILKFEELKKNDYDLDKYEYCEKPWF